MTANIRSHSCRRGNASHQLLPSGRGSTKQSTPSHPASWPKKNVGQGRRRGRDGRLSTKKTLGHSEAERINASRMREGQPRLSGKRTRARVKGEEGRLGKKCSKEKTLRRTTILSHRKKVKKANSRQGDRRLLEERRPPKGQHRVSSSVSLGTTPEQRGSSSISLQLRPRATSSRTRLNGGKRDKFPAHQAVCRRPHITQGDRRIQHPPAHSKEGHSPRCSTKRGLGSSETERNPDRENQPLEKNQTQLN